MKSLSKGVLITAITVLFIGCDGGGGGDSKSNSSAGSSSTGTVCENILSETPNTTPDMSVGATYSSLHHSFLAGTTITGTYANEPYSVTLTCDHTHKTQIGNLQQSVGSYVVDYDGNVSGLFLYDMHSTGHHIITFDGTELITNSTVFDGTGTVETITRTEECQEESSISDTGFSCADTGNGYLTCSYKFNLVNSPDNGEIQQKAFHYDLPSAGELTVELNRWGAHVNLTDGANELLNFARTNDYCEGYNTESTLLIEGSEIPYRELAPDTEIRDLMMTNMPENPVSVQLKSGIGIAPHNNAYCPTGHYDTQHTPFFDGCYGCYGNHCLHHYTPSGGDLGQFQHTAIQFEFYAPKAKAPCKGSISEGVNTWMTSNTGAEHGGSTLPSEGKPDPDGNPDEQNATTRWYFKLDYSGQFGAGTMSITNLQIDCNNPYNNETCGEADGDYGDTHVSYSGNLHDDPGLTDIFVNLKYVQVSMLGIADEQLSADLFATHLLPNYEKDLWGCEGDWSDSDVQKLKNGEAFSISASGVTTCTFTFKPCKDEACNAY
jgi:hypothetical protein